MHSPKANLQASLQEDSKNTTKQGDSIPDELTELISLWVGLPGNIKEAIRAIIKPFRK